MGDSLYDSRVLPDDLVRQMRPALNRLSVMKGVYDPTFIGDTQVAKSTCFQSLSFSYEHHSAHFTNVANISFTARSHAIQLHGPVSSKPPPPLKPRHPTTDQKPRLLTLNSDHSLYLPKPLRRSACVSDARQERCTAQKGSTWRT